MLAKTHRLVSSVDFSTTVRSGVRKGRRNVVLYMRTIAAEEPSRAGFIVSKAVGNAVVRNLVKRRLRELVAQQLLTAPYGCAVVVRALPPAAAADFVALSSDVDAAWVSAVQRLAAIGTQTRNERG